MALILRLLFLVLILCAQFYDDATAMDPPKQINPWPEQLTIAGGKWWSGHYMTAQKYVSYYPVGTAHKEATDHITIDGVKELSNNKSFLYFHITVLAAPNKDQVSSLTGKLMPGEKLKHEKTFAYVYAIADKKLSKIEDNRGILALDPANSSDKLATVFVEGMKNSGIFNTAPVEKFPSSFYPNRSYNKYSSSNTRHPRGADQQKKGTPIKEVEDEKQGLKRKQDDPGKSPQKKQKVDPQPPVVQQPSQEEIREKRRAELAQRKMEINKQYEETAGRKDKNDRQGDASNGDNN